MALGATVHASQAVMPPEVAAALRASKAQPAAGHPALATALSVDNVSAGAHSAGTGAAASNSLRLLRLAEEAYTRALERDPLNDEVVTEVLVTRVMLLSDPAYIGA